MRYANDMRFLLPSGRKLPDDTRNNNGLLHDMLCKTVVHSCKLCWSQVAQSDACRCFELMACHVCLLHTWH